MSSLIINRGSDASFPMVWEDALGVPLDLSGRVVEILDASSPIAANLTGEVTDGLNGVVTLYLEGTEPIRVGKYLFRVQLNTITIPVDSISTPLINLEIR